MQVFTQKQNRLQRPVHSSVARFHTKASRLAHRTDPVLYMQRTLGNQVVQRMVQPHAEALQSLAMNKPGDGSEQASVPASVHEVLRSSGQPLDAATRAFMEPRFGSDFGHVRVHTDQKAAQSAQAVNALAYTVGNGIVFSQGQWSPQSQSGKHLLAHELAHVVQQSNGLKAVQRQSPQPVKEQAKLPTKTFYGITPEIFACVKKMSLEAYGTKYEPKDANVGEAISHYMADVTLGFVFDASAKTLTYTIKYKSTMLATEGRIFGGIEKFINACQKK